MTRQELWEAMTSQTRVSLTDTSGGILGLPSLDRPSGPRPIISGLIASIAMEDGSGYSFNVTLRLGKEHGYGTCTVYVRCQKPQYNVPHQNTKS